LKAATSGGAAIAGFREIGAIEPGSPACMIAVRGNPLEDLNCLKEIECLILPRDSFSSGSFPVPPREVRQL
jgi:hypothetical protein